VLRFGAYDRCNAQFEFFNGFDFALLLHSSTPLLPNVLNALQHLVAACGDRSACAACDGFGIARNTATTFDVFYWLQVMNFDVPLLHSAPNRADYIDILGLSLHCHLSLSTFILGCQSNPIVANVFISEKVTEMLLNLLRRISRRIKAGFVYIYCGEPSSWDGLATLGAVISLISPDDRPTF